MDEESDWYPQNVKLAANTIGYAAELEGVTLDRQQVLTIAVYLDHHGLLAKCLPAPVTDTATTQTST